MHIFSVLSKGLNGRKNTDIITDLDNLFVKVVSDNRDGKSFATLAGEILVDITDSLFVDFSMSQILLWGNNNAPAFLKIISTLALLRKPEERGMIYVVGNSFSGQRLLVHYAQVISDIGYDGHQYSAVQEELVLSQPFENPAFNNKKCCDFKIIKGDIAVELYTWLSSGIYPTSDLIDFVDNGFLNKEEVSSRLRYARPISPYS